MRPDESQLYEQFTAARRRAVELTDTYHATAADDPRRAILWDEVMRQTELARGLLEHWLESEKNVRQLVAAAR